MVRRIRKLLVANRGEIAVRIMRTCRDMGISTVAVFSEADRTSLHVRMADEAQAVGAAPARASYLNSDNIVETARRSGCDAVHPGYGFLSERADFARAVEAAGLVFVGPPADAIEVMGNKTRARARMVAAGVPVVPGENGEAGRGLTAVAEVHAAARRLGFPVMLKAAAGGGGRGMRLVDDEERLDGAFAAAQREAEAAFGDGAVYLEKAVVRPRHVEVQIFGDQQGRVVHLYERDCSVQRRHQKVIEEAPSPAVSPALRARMGELACEAGRAVGYRGAGTCEFLLAADGEFYFLEMNTRLQVEHPVTEMITRLDLVRLQILVAEGEPLPTDLPVGPQGHAIECRVYAEDPVQFLPSPGTIRVLRTPAGPFVRDDSGVLAGSRIPVEYDAMISKLVAWGTNRGEAIARMARALDEYHVGGIETNLPFHRRVMRHPEFRSGVYDTGFIERHRQELCRAEPEGVAGEMGVPLDGTLAVLALAKLQARPESVPAPVGPSPWRRALWR